ncbi:MAG: hypothetical protein GIW99_01230 [Candidatus Eremiobacteraeota bacterium]|nr:hypothetical protein [Candidatus Eremiobacteraeota bacterium]MBC5826309.1 hypothetical protein [Candidatus Eremiobacteraeota bacterium]
MSLKGDESRLPADMLLLNERRRRLEARASVSSAPDFEDVDDDRIVDDDVAPRSLETSAKNASHAITLYRPLGLLNLGALAWSGKIDEQALTLAIACGPIAAQALAMGLDAPWYRTLRPLWLTALPTPETSLVVELTHDDLEAIALAGAVNMSAAAELALAAALPLAILGADSPARSAAKPVLGAYRNAVLVHAWRRFLGGTTEADIDREGHAAAVALLSTLRALLGES